MNLQQPDFSISSEVLVLLPENGAGPSRPDPLEHILDWSERHYNISNWRKAAEVLGDQYGSGGGVCFEEV